MLKLGTQDISALYLGETKIKRAYLGETPVFEGSKPSRLPEGYTEVEYIESSGTQYINTGVKPSTSLTFSIDFYISSLTSDTICFFGNYAKIPLNHIQYRAFINKTLWIAYNKQFFGFENPITVGHHTITLIAYTKKAVFDDETISIVPNETPSFSRNGPIALFASNSNGTADLHSSIRLYSCQIYSQSSGPTYTYYRDFVPCIDPSGAVGLYDLIDEKFYRNNGTGAFTAGPPV